MLNAAETLILIVLGTLVSLAAREAFEVFWTKRK